MKKRDRDQEDVGGGGVVSFLDSVSVIVLYYFAAICLFYMDIQYQLRL